MRSSSLVADLSLDKIMLQDVLKKSGEALAATRHDPILVHVRAFHQTLKTEEVYSKLYASPAEARESLEIFRRRYNEIRPHWALAPVGGGGDVLTPADGLYAWIGAQASEVAILARAPHEKLNELARGARRQRWATERPGLAVTFEHDGALSGSVKTAGGGQAREVDPVAVSSSATEGPANHRFS